MHYKYVLIFILFLIVKPGFTQTTNQYGLQIIDNKADYSRNITLDSNARLVEIEKYIPNIKLDIRYASTNNFSGQAVYEQARAFARLPVVLALAGVQKELKAMGLGLKIYDAYRPYSVTVKFFEVAKDKDFVASPKTGSRHNRGCAVDVTLINLKTGKELKMPTPFDSFAPEAAADFQDVRRKLKNNRAILIDVMSKYEFKVLDNEWWHFDFNGWKAFDLMDIPFKKL